VVKNPGAAVAAPNAPSASAAAAMNLVEMRFMRCSPAL
jgi:hypothetical protein